MGVVVRCAFPSTGNNKVCLHGRSSCYQVNSIDLDDDDDMLTKVTGGVSKDDFSSRPAIVPFKPSPEIKTDPKT